MKNFSTSTSLLYIHHFYSCVSLLCIACEWYLDLWFLLILNFLKHKAQKKAFFLCFFFLPSLFIFFSFSASPYDFETFFFFMSTAQRKKESLSRWQQLYTYTSKIQKNRKRRQLNSINLISLKPHKKKRLLSNLIIFSWITFLFLQLHQTLTDMKYFNAFAVEYQLLDIFLIFMLYSLKSFQVERLE